MTRIFIGEELLLMPIGIRTAASVTYTMQEVKYMVDKYKDKTIPICTRKFEDGQFKINTERVLGYCTAPYINTTRDYVVTKVRYIDASENIFYRPVDVSVYVTGIPDNNNTGILRNLQINGIVIY